MATAFSTSDCTRHASSCPRQVDPIARWRRSIRACSPPSCTARKSDRRARFSLTQDLASIRSEVVSDLEIIKRLEDLEKRVATMQGEQATLERQRDEYHRLYLETM